MLTPIGSDRFADRLCLPFDLASDTSSLARNDDSVQYIVACEERRQALPLLDNLPPASHRRQLPHRCRLVVATPGAYFACPQRAFKAFWCVFEVIYGAYIRRYPRGYPLSPADIPQGMRMCNFAEIAIGYPHPNGYPDAYRPSLLACEAARQSAPGVRLSTPQDSLSGLSFPVLTTSS
ncbi:hypothetical protein PGTUg99_016695 [Puccinia graminis f. sp. tritici]|uniref:Uncharacterized protein n=1 Tax=Puccinia graminis f. sp. tritici TaxID=56615 RepID=A0A5B0PL33_PUCGR|nr:hypothetical protein PGTUg99_016695 [Puccinia graminis f. sp. tritici]